MESAVTFVDKVKAQRGWQLGLAATTLVVVYGLFSVIRSDSTPVAPPPQVPVAKVVRQDIPIFMELVGQTIGSLDISIRARVEGTLEGMHFEEGTPVKKEQLLYTIDPRPFEAKVVEAKSKLAEATTQLAKADSDLKRVKPLAKMDAVSKRDLDAAVAQDGAAKASVDAARASLDYAKIELGYTKVESPIDGLIGISEAKVGDFVGKTPNPVVLNMVSQIDPIHVRVSLSERDYLRLGRQYLETTGVETITDGSVKRREEKKPLKLILSDGSVHPHEGYMKVVNSQVDPTTGTLTMEAAFPNPRKLLRPGQFARIKAIAEMREDAILVPQRAVQELQGTFSVFVVEEGNKVTSKQVQPGPKAEKLWVIEKGLTPDDVVVVEGHQRLRPGMEVNPQKVEVAVQDQDMPESGATS